MANAIVETMKQHLLAALLFFALAPVTSSADELVVRINSGRDYKRYSNAELQKRVYDLELAVMQLQQRLFQIEMKPAPQVIIQAPPPPVVVKPEKQPEWTCSVEAFGDVFAVSNVSRAKAEAAVRGKCAEASNAIHCSNVKCAQ